jgi:hypothetical protein
MAVSLYAGNRHCRPDPRREYSSGESCDLMVHYQNGGWIWKIIR